MDEEEYITVEFDPIDLPVDEFVSDSEPDYFKIRIEIFKRLNDHTYRPNGNIISKLKNPHYRQEETMFDNESHKSPEYIIQIEPF